MSIKYKKGTFTTVPNIKILKGQCTQIQALFMWICIYADENGQCFPARSRLAKDMKVTVKTIDKYMKDLINLGLIEKEVRKDDKKKSRNLTNIYQIMVVEGGEYKDPGERSTLGVGNEVPQGGVLGSLGVGNETTQRTKPNLTKPNLTKESILLEIFEEFWKEYPKKIAKSVCEAKWLKFTPLEALAILDDVKARTAKDIQWLDGFAPHPSTYLNQKRWNDEIISVRPGRPNNLGSSTPYKKGKYADDKSIIG